MDSVVIGLASAADLPSCLMLTPEVAGLAPEFLSAKLDGVVIGAAAIMWEAWADPAGFPIVVHVIPNARRRGVGKDLIRCAVDLVSGETEGLWTLGSIQDDDPALPFLHACGFKAEKIQLHFRVDGAVFHRSIADLLSRLHRRDRIPASASIVSADQVALDAVARLVASEFQSSPVQMLERLVRSQSDPNGFDLARSVVAMDGGAVAGALLLRWENAYPIIDALAVAQPWRNRWANTMLLEAATRRGLEGGATHFRFRCGDDLKNSINLASRGDGERVASEAEFYYAIA